MIDVLVSVIVPVYDGERYVRATIASVVAQTYRPIEIIVVDDGSRDGTAEAVRDCRAGLHYRHQEHAGAAAARNTGVAMARGEFLAFIDADDLWTPDKLARQMAVLQSEVDLDMVFGHVRHFFSPDLEPGARDHVVCPPDSMPGYHPGCMLIRAEAFLRAGPFDPTYTVGEFVDWYGRAKDRGLRSTVLPDVMMERRIHDRNAVTVKRANRTDYVRALKTALDRRRTLDSKRGGE